MFKKLRIDKEAPWKRRFDASTILWARGVKGAPTRGIVASTKSGTYQWYAWDVPSGELSPLTKLPAEVLSRIAPDGLHEEAIYGISPDGRYLVYLKDEGGDDIGHFVRLPIEGGEPEDITPDTPPYASYAVFFSDAGNALGFTAQSEQLGFQTYIIQLLPNGELGSKRVVYESRSPLAGPWLSHGGEIAVVASAERTRPPNCSLVAVDTASGKQIGGLWDGEQTNLMPSSASCGFSPVPGDCRLLTRTSRTGSERPVLWEPTKGERIDMALEEVAGGLSPVGWSPDGKSILLAQARQAGQQLYVCELKDHDLKRLNHPDGTYQVLRFDQEGEILALWQDVLQPPQVVALDAETGAKTRTVLSAGEAPPSRGWQCVSFPSSEGRMVQGWLAVPDGEGPFPTVLYVYHGPGGATFHPEGQAWLDHGFACASIHNMIAADIGLRALEDVVAFRDWLVKNRMTNPDQIILTGWSYGGYLTLLALGKYPDLWAGGMAGTAIADWSTLYEDTSPAGRSRVLSLFGGTPQDNSSASMNLRVSV